MPITPPMPPPLDPALLASLSPERLAAIASCRIRRAAPVLATHGAYDVILGDEPRGRDAAADCRLAAGSRRDLPAGGWWSPSIRCRPASSPFSRRLLPAIRSARRPGLAWRRMPVSTCRGLSVCCWPAASLPARIRHLRFLTVHHLRPQAREPGAAGRHEGACHDPHHRRPGPPTVRPHSSRASLRCSRAHPAQPRQ